jgi:hypothetical protein
VNVLGQIIEFPKAAEQTPRCFDGKAVLRVVCFIWVIIAILWPVLRWIIAFDVTLQALRMLVLFSKVGIFLDWMFITHFLGFTALLCFVSLYRPK